MRSHDYHRPDSQLLRETDPYLAEGEIHPRELDWVAIQRLKQAKLIEERVDRPGLTPDGRRAWQAILAKDWAQQH